MTDPEPKQEQRQTQDLFERILDKVNGDPMKALLAKAKEEIPGEFGVSGSNQELVDHLKKAEAVGSVTRQQVFALLQEAEENGDQTILYYTPKTDAIRDLCSDPDEVAKKLFGEGWRETSSFPYLPRLANGSEVVDFRTHYAGKAKDWLMKVYTF